MRDEDPETAGYDQGREEFREIIRDMLPAVEALVAAVSNMRVPQTVVEAGIQIHLTIGPVLKQAREAVATAKEKAGIS